MDKIRPTPEAPAKRKKLALGRGLGALLPGGPAEGGPDGDYFLCDIDLIRPNPVQPRRRFDEAELEELAASIRRQGILQPLVVRRSPGGFELIAGERRLRAARRAGLSRVPVVLREVSDDRLLEISLVENIQRAELNPLEEAEAYHQLIHRLQLTQEEVAARVGKSRSTVANFLRLRQLPPPIRQSIEAGELSMGHARALLSSEEPAQQLAAWREVVGRGLSVRETEALMRRLKEAPKERRVRPQRPETLHLERLAEDLARVLGTKVTLRARGPRGRIEIEFYSPDDLERLIEHLRRGAR
ncbi:MAG: ParB/RepB/Spo0J family partition protein [Desulfobacterales bacterium]